MKKINIFLIIIAVIILIISGFVIFPNQAKDFFSQTEIGAPQKNIGEKAVLIIDDGEGLKGVQGPRAGL